MPLSTDDLNYLRLILKDDCTTKDISDDELNILYSNNANDRCKTLIDAYNVLIAKERRNMRIDFGDGTVESSAVATSLESTRDYWARQCGENEGSLQVGYFDMKLDADTPS